MHTLQYKLALFVHLVGVLTLFAGIGIELGTMYGMRIARTVGQVQQWGSVVTAIEPVIPVSAVVILGSGIYMVTRAWSWTVPWSDVGLVFLVVIGLLAPVVHGRRLKRINHAADRAVPGVIPPSLDRSIQDPIIWTSIQTSAGLALGVVFLMTLKPATWVAAIAAMLVSGALGAASALPHWQRQRAEAKRRAAADSQSNTRQS